MTIDERSDAVLAAVVRRYQVAFTRRCDCGSPECAKPRLAEPDDYRVVACSLFAAIKSCASTLEAGGDPKLAVATMGAALRFGRGSLGKLLDESASSFDLEVEDLARFMAELDERQGAVLMPLLESAIADELAETSRDVALEILDEESGLRARRRRDVMPDASPVARRRADPKQPTPRGS